MNKPTFPIAATILLVSLMLATLGIVGGIFYATYKTDYAHRKLAAIDHSIYLRTLQDPDRDKDGLSNLAEIQIYKSDPGKFDAIQSGMGDGEYIYNLNKKAFETNNENPLLQYRQNLTAYNRSNTASSSAAQYTATLSLEGFFNLRALETYNLYVGLPDELITTVKAGLVARKNGDYQKSLTLLQDALSKNPDSALLKYHLGLTYHGMKEFDKALQIYKSLENNPTVMSPLLYHDLASANYALGNGDEVVRYYRLSIKTFPEDLFQYLDLATYYQEKNDLNKAKDVLNEGLKIEPRYASYYNALAIIAGLQGDNKTEFELYKKAVAYDFRYAPGHLNLSIQYDEFNKDPKNALIEARIAYDLDPSPRHLSQVILQYSKTGDIAKSQLLESQLLKMNDVDSVSLNALGLMYLDKQDLKKGRILF